MRIPVFVVALLIASPAAAQNGRTVDVVRRNYEVADSYRLDLTVPEAPAFAMLGLDSAEAATPRDTPALWADLANLVGDDGTLKNGGALTVQPYWLGNRRITIDDYAARNRFWERALLARTRFSLATAEVPDADGAVRLGLGVTFEPLDFLDPRVDRLTAAETARGETNIDVCLNSQTEPLESALRVGIREQIDAAHPDWAAAAADSANPEAQAAALVRIANETRVILAQRREQVVKGEGDFDPAVYQRFSTGAQACIDQWRTRQARRPNLIIAIGHTMISQDGQFDNLDSEGGTIWVGYSQTLPISRLFPSADESEFTSRVNFYARFADAEQVGVDADTMAEAEVTVGAVSLNLSRNRRWQVGVEAAHREEQFADSSLDRSYNQFSVNGSFRLNDQIWVRGSYGTRDNDEKSEFIRISLVFAERAQD